MSVTSESDLSALTVDQINYLIAEAGEDIVVDGARYLGMNASNEFQYEVTYNSVGAGAYITNHAFVDFDLQGDPRLIINDLDAEEDLFA